MKNSEKIEMLKGFSGKWMTYRIADLGEGEVLFKYDGEETDLKAVRPLENGRGFVVLNPVGRAKQIYELMEEN